MGQLLVKTCVPDVHLYLIEHKLLKLKLKFSQIKNSQIVFRLYKFQITVSLGKGIQILSVYRWSKPTFTFRVLCTFIQISTISYQL